jgi:hypothetical protein
MKNIFLISILLFTLTGNTQTDDKIKPNFENLISDFVSSEWIKVYKAKDSLLNIGKESIPHLIKLLDDPKSFNKLKNTADLIYPGANEFYGHGWVIDYD